MSDQNQDYPPSEPEGTEPTMPGEGVPPDPIVGTEMGGNREDAEQPRHGTIDTGRSGTGASSPTAAETGTPPTEKNSG